MIKAAVDSGINNSKLMAPYTGHVIKTKQTLLPPLRHKGPAKSIPVTPNVGVAIRVIRLLGSGAKGVSTYSFAFGMPYKHGELS